MWNWPSLDVTRLRNGTSKQLKISEWWLISTKMTNTSFNKVGSKITAELRNWQYPDAMWWLRPSEVCRATMQMLCLYEYQTENKAFIDKCKTYKRSVTEWPLSYDHCPNYKDLAIYLAWTLYHCFKQQNTLSCELCNLML